MASTSKPPPPETIPPSSPSKDDKNKSSSSPTSYQAARQNELDAIRRKGLTKIFNRHFTTAHSKIQKERDAAEAALNDIETRKAELAANPKSFDNQLGGDGVYTLTQLDAMHFELQRRKQTVQRKERETQLLYKRYVSQYGGKGGSAATDIPPAFRKNSMSSTGSSTGLGNSLTNTMPIVHEANDEVVRQADLLMARAMEKIASENNAKVVDKSKQIEHGTIYDQASPVPPVSMYSSPIPKSDTLKTPDKKAPISTSVLSPEPPSYASPEIVPTNDGPSPQEQITTQQPLPPVSSPGDSLGQSAGDPDSSFFKAGVHDVGGDDGSTLSGLTSIDGATVAEAEFRLTEFLRVETENIRNMFKINDDDGEEGTSTILGANSSGVGEELGSVTSPSTLKSVDSKRTEEASKAAKQAEDLAQKMKDATAWMKDPTLLEEESDNDGSEEKKDNFGEKRVSATASSSVFSSGNSVISVSSRNTLTRSIGGDTEWMAFWSDEHKRVYYHNSNTNQTCWSEPANVKIDRSAAEESKPADDDKSYQDDNVVLVKDYSKPSPAKRGMDGNKSGSGMSKKHRDIDDVMSVGSGSIASKSTRVKAYQRRRAIKRRKRVRAMIAVSILCIISLTFYQTRERWMPLMGLQTARQKAEEEAKLTSEERSRAAKKREAEKKKAEEERKRKEELERKKKELEAKKKAEEEQKRTEEKLRREKDERKKKELEKELEETKKKLEEDKKRREEIKLKKQRAEEKRKQQLEEKERLRKELEEQIRQEERIRAEEEYAKQLVLKKEEEASVRDDKFAVVTEDSITRPGWCLIPGVWVVSKRCRLLANKKPVYDLKALTDSMIQ